MKTKLSHRDELDWKKVKGNVSSVHTTIDAIKKMAIETASERIIFGQD